MNRQIEYANRKVDVIYEVDTVVVGGGTAGAVTGISAARGGNNTLVVEKSIALGGSQTNALVAPMMPTYVDKFSLNKEIIDRLEEAGCGTSDGRSSSSWFNGEKLTYLLERMLKESGGNILYDASLVDVVKEKDEIKYIIVTTCEGLVAIGGKNFVDATGDALLSRMSGVKTNSGDVNGDNQLMSFRFEMAGINVDRLREYMISLKDTFCQLSSGDYYEIAFIKGRGFVLEPLFMEGYKNGELEEDNLRYFQAFTVPGKRGVMTFNCPNIVQINQSTTAKDRSRAVIVGRRLMNKLVKFLIKNFPGFEDAYLSREASALGVRESYRIEGKYTLNENDYIKRARFEDGVVKGDWYLDVHSVNERSLEEDKPLERGEYYEIPYRSLITKNISNLIVVGRCISTTFLMQSSIRIQPTLRDMGEVAGDACVYSVKNNISLNEIDGKVIRKI